MFLGANRQGDYLTASTSSWEIFGLVKDDSPPTIVPQTLKEGVQLTASAPKLVFTVKDRGSGVAKSSLEMTLDGEKLPAEWDPPRSRFLFQPWWNLSLGNHTVEVKASDRIGNTSSRKLQFSISEGNP